MSKPINIQLKELFRAFERDRDKLENDISRIVFSNAFEGNDIAKQKAPKAFGKLAQGIGVVRESKLKASVVSNMDYSPFVEFGTGGKVDVPAEWQQMAASLKRTVRGGGFEQGLQSIKDWCRLKGIDEAAAYPIFITILEKGVRPQPFMYPAWKKTKKQFTKDMKAYVSRQPR